MCCLHLLVYLIAVVPSPNLLMRLYNTYDDIITAGSKTYLWCYFESATDTKISQIHWLFNSSDLAGCSRFENSINCTVIQQSIDENHITSTLIIHPVQTENVGLYTCYCSYNTSLLNVDGVQVIESDHIPVMPFVQSTTLPVQSTQGTA